MSGTEATRGANRRQYERRVVEGLCRSCGVKSKSRKPKPGMRLCNHCLKNSREYYYRDRKKNLSANQRYREKLRAEVFEAYGGTVCACCGDNHPEFMTIDHINGDGAAHRREIGKSTYKLLLWLKKSGFPPGFRILCMNCNFSYGMKGYCPHQKEKQHARRQ